MAARGPRRGAGRVGIDSTPSVSAENVPLNRVGSAPSLRYDTVRVTLISCIIDPAHCYVQARRASSILDEIIANTSFDICIVQN